MKKLALLLIIPLALYFYIAERNLWRPRTIEIRDPFTFAISHDSIENLEFSGDGQLLIAGLQTHEDSQDIALYDCSAKRTLQIIKEASRHFLTAQDDLVILPYYDRPQPRNDIDIYGLRDGQFFGGVYRKTGFFPYASLPDSRTLLGGVFTQQDPYPGSKILSWNYAPHALPSPQKLSGRLQVQPFSPLPPLPAPAEHAVQSRGHTASELYASRAVWPLADGKTLLLVDVTDNDATPCCKDLTLQVWNIVQRKTLWRLKPTMPLDLQSVRHIRVASTPDGLLALYGLYGLAYSKDKSLEIWNYKTGRRASAITPSWPGTAPLPARRSPSHFRIEHLALAPDGTLLAAVSDPGIGLWDTKTGQCIRVLKSPQHSFRCSAFSPNSHTLATGSSNGMVTLWRVQ